MRKCQKCGYECLPGETADAGICAGGGLVFVKWVDRSAPSACRVWRVVQ